LTAHREVMDRLIAEHSGRIANTAGDSVLAEFPSVVDAVQCAVAVQEALAHANQDAAVERRLLFRIGIHVGDVIVRGGDLLGDGVNIAARLQSIADPGGICISEATYGYVRKVVPVGFTELGPQSVRNMEEPIQTYAVKVISPAPAELTQTKPLSLPERPSIAVLPFTNMSPDPEQEFFAGGMTEDIITGLSRLRWLSVMTLNSTLTDKGRVSNVRHVGRNLGVRYVLEGSVRKSGSRIRIIVQLIEAETANHVWGEKYDRSVTDIFDLQDEITESVVAAIEPHVYAREGLRTVKQSPESISTWGLVVRAIGLINRVARQENEDARHLLNRAIALEPLYAKAHAVLSWAVYWASVNYWLADERKGQEDARRHAEDALTIDPGEPWARMVLGFCLSKSGQHEQALRELESALQINPSFALGRSIHGWALTRAGRFDAAVEETSKALHLSPSDSYLSFYETLHGLALFAKRHFAEALPYIRKAIVAFPEFPWHHALLISCCGHLGFLEEAKMQLAHRNSLPGPALTVSLVRHQLHKYAHARIMTEGLSKAGVPES
jgi:adenylate cyclase